MVYKQQAVHRYYFNSYGSTMTKQRVGLKMSNKCGLLLTKGQH